MDKKQARAKIFEGTQQLYTNSDRLKKDVEKSCLEQKIYWEGGEIECGEPRFSNSLKLVFSKQKVVRDDFKEEIILPEEEWYTMDVITCAAPDIRITGDETEYAPDEEELYSEFVKR